MFELKYLKVGTPDEKIRIAADEGMRQILQYSSAPELAEVENLKKWVLVFVGDRCAINQEV